MEYVLIYSFMTEILVMCVKLKYLNDLSPSCRTRSSFTMFAKPTSVCDHEPDESSAHIHKTKSFLCLGLKNFLSFCLQLNFLCSSYHPSLLHSHHLAKTAKL